MLIRRSHIMVEELTTHNLQKWRRIHSPLTKVFIKIPITADAKEKASIVLAPLGAQPVTGDGDRYTFIDGDSKDAEQVARFSGL